MVLLGLSLATLGRGQDAPAAPEADRIVIEEIRLHGLSRTEPDYVLELLGCPLPCRLAAPDDLRRLEHRLLRTHLFHEVHADVADTTLHLHLRERWSPVLAPFATLDGWRERYGLAYLDANLRGRGELLVLVGELVDGGAGLESKLVLSQVFDEDLGLVVRTTTGRYRRAELGVRGAGAEERLVDGHEVDLLGILAGPLWAFGVLHVNPRLGVSSVKANPYLGFEVPAGGMDLVFRLHLELDARRDEGSPQGTGPCGRLVLGGGSLAGGYGLAEAWIEEVFPSWHSLVLTLRAALGAGLNRPEYELTRLGGPAGEVPLRGRERESLWGDQYAVAGLELARTLFTHDIGTLTALVFHDHGAAVRSDWSSDRRSAASGGGLRMYLTRIAVPAMGLDLSYSHELGTLLASATLGARF